MSGFSVEEKDTREFTLLPKAVQLAAAFPLLREFFAQGDSGFTLTVNAGARVGGTSVTASIEEFDLSANDWIATALLTGAAITAAGVQRLTVSPHVATAANVSVQMCAPRRCRLRIVETGGITSQDVGASVRFFS